MAQEEISLDNIIDAENGTEKSKAQKEQEKIEQEKREKEEKEKKERQEGQEGQEGQEEEQEEVQISEEEKTEFQEAYNAIQNDDTLKKEFLDIFKGSDVDEDGNILDENGEVSLSYKEAVKKYSEQEDAQYDEEGNELDDNGNIVRTFKEIEAEKNPYNKTAQKYGIQPKDERGELKVYPEGERGAEELVNDILETKTTEEVTKYLKQNPTLERVANHILAGNSIETFNSSMDYSSMDLDNLSSQESLNIIKKRYQREGATPKMAERFANTLKEDEISDELKDSVQALKKIDEEENKKNKEKIKQEEKIREQKELEYWNGIKNTIQQGKVDNLEIPQKDRDSFYDYLHKPVEGNKSQHDLDVEAMEDDKLLKEAYLRFKGGDISDLVNQEASKKRYNSFKEKIRKQREKQGKSFNNSKGKGNEGKVSINDISIDNIK